MDHHDNHVLRMWARGEAIRPGMSRVKLRNVVRRGSADRWTDRSVCVLVLSPRPEDGGTRRSASDEAGGSVSAWRTPPAAKAPPLMGRCVPPPDGGGTGSGRLPVISYLLILVGRTTACCLPGSRRPRSFPKCHQCLGRVDHEERDPGGDGSLIRWLRKGGASPFECRGVDLILALGK